MTIAAQIPIACQVIEFSGSYTLQADATVFSGPGCIVVDNLAAVHLDCAGHDGTSLMLIGVTDSTFTNCKFSLTVRATNVTRVSIDHDSVLNGIQMTAAVSSAVTNNVVTGGVYGISLSGGHDNQVASNTIDGKYDGSGQQVGEDDGVILLDEVNSSVHDNSIKNVFDAGVEGADRLAMVTIASNTITNAGEAGVASYWCTNWTATTVSNNQVSVSPALVWILYETSNVGLCGTGNAPLMFMNNQFTGNRLDSPLPSASSTGFNVSLGQVPAAVFNNTITGNVVGSGLGMNLQPIAGFIDGGGNLCQAGSGFCGGSTGPALISARWTASVGAPRVWAHRRHGAAGAAQRRP